METLGVLLVFVPRNRGVVYLFSVLILISDPDSFKSVISVFFTGDTMTSMLSVWDAEGRGVMLQWRP